MGREPLPRVALCTRSLLFVHIFSQKQGWAQRHRFISRKPDSITVPLALKISGKLLPSYSFTTSPQIHCILPMAIHPLLSLTDAHCMHTQGGPGTLSHQFETMGQGGTGCFGTNSGGHSGLPKGAPLLFKECRTTCREIWSRKICSSLEQMRKLFPRWCQLLA